MNRSFETSLLYRSRHIKRCLQAALFASLMTAMCSAILAQGGDDWVLVQRFEEQLKKANAGDPQAMYEVGRMYERGRGTGASIDKAINWCERAATKGQSSARARLGIMYLEGQGVPQDYQQAYKNLSEAARSGVPAAQYFLALMYEQGHGVKANTKTAMIWYKRAAQGGYYQAKKGVARLEALARRPILAQPPEQTMARPKRKAPAKQPAKRNLARGLMETVLNGHWQRNGKAVGFLPSSASTCTEEANNVLKCLSAEQNRKTGFSIIHYVTVASLTNFSANDEFNISYHNHVLRVEDENKTVATGADDDEEYSAAPSAATSHIKLGRQKTEHKLECTLESDKKLVCIKNLTNTLTFKNKK